MAGALAGQGMHVAIPACRMGEPADLDGLVASRASSSSGYITGQSIVLDGGCTLI
jgi:NAD(P)-dependent dehydrogenase (short-subunit alcohol dehydrogenase family)